MRNIKTNTKDSNIADAVEAVCKFIEEFDYEKDFDGFCDSALSVKTIKSNCEVVGHEVLLAYGGPTIWYDSRKGRVFGSWWSDSFDADPEETREFDEMLFECFYE